MNSSMSKSVLCLILLLTSAVIACSDNSKSLTKDEFGEDWPFNVESGKVYCVDGIIVVFETNGNSYALNDAARLSGNYKNIRDILRPDANYPGKKITMDLSLIEFEGLKLCEK